MMKFIISLVIVGVFVAGVYLINKDSSLRPHQPVSHTTAPTHTATTPSHGDFYETRGHPKGFSFFSPNIREIGSDEYAAYRTVVDQQRKSGQIYLFYFDFDEWKSVRNNKSIADLLAAITNQQQQLRWVLIRGHTDSIGSDAYNDVLALKRARSLATSLPDVPVLIEAVGEREPAGDNTTDQGRAGNRRAEAIIILQPATAPADQRK